MPVISLDEALRRIAQLPTLALGSEDISLEAALGRILAAPILLANDQPAFDRATMDGYAVALPAPAHGLVRVVGTQLAGQEPLPSPEPGQALRIMTGAITPATCSVVPNEDATPSGDWVQVHTLQLLQQRRNVALKGEDGRSGDTVLTPGTRLSPALVALAALAGVQRIQVQKELHAAVFISGDEVGDSGVAGIADSNGPLIGALLQHAGISCTRHHLPDQAEAVRHCFASCSAPLILTSGGVSQGDKDLIPGQAAAAGFVPVFHGVAVQPGKPVLLARHPDGRVLLGLPGNPVSVLATAHLFLFPLIAHVRGQAPAPQQLAPLATPWPGRNKRLLLLPARWQGAGLAPLHWNGSGDLIAAASGEAFLRLEPGRAYATGDLVPYIPYAGHHAGNISPLALQRSTC